MSRLMVPAAAVAAAAAIVTAGCASAGASVTPLWVAMT